MLPRETFARPGVQPPRVAPPCVFTGVTEDGPFEIVIIGTVTERLPSAVVRGSVEHEQSALVVLGVSALTCDDALDGVGDRWQFSDFLRTLSGLNAKTTSRLATTTS